MLLVIIIVFIKNQSNIRGKGIFQMNRKMEKFFSNSKPKRLKQERISL